MEDAAASSEPLARRSKRPRVRVSRFNLSDIVTAADSKEPRDQSSNLPDHGGDFDEVPPKTKRSRTAEQSTARVGYHSLIDVINSNTKLIPSAVKLWVEQYEKDPKPAIADLLTMSFEACGVKHQIDGDFEEADVHDVVVHMVNLARNGEVDDDQSPKRKDFNHFKDNLVYFWDKLATECQNGPLFDGVVFDKCTDYVIALSCTPLRFCRQVASLIGLQLLTSFTTISKTLRSHWETTQRQLNAEKKKHVDGPHVESLDKRLSETHEKITKIEKMMSKISRGLFVHGYRDSDPNIQMSCIQSLSEWVSSYPTFLQDLYLKLKYWTLSDESPGVRKASVVALQSLFEIDDHVPSLGLFTERFSNRMIELADDVDISIAVSAIGLVRPFLRHQLLKDDYIGPLCDLVTDVTPEIRHGIGGLVYGPLTAQKSASYSSSKGTDEGSSLVTLSRMLQILREFSTDEILISYLIDDVWEIMKAMEDWKSIISILLDETPSIELIENDATNLIRLLSASVRKAVGESIAPAADDRKQHFTKAQKDVFESSKRNITLAMMKNYPLLLRKYMADQANVPSLVEIIRHMNLGLYSFKRQEQNFKAAFELLKEAYLGHSDKESLRSCVHAINFCTTESEGELQDFVFDKLNQLEEELLFKLKSAMKAAAEDVDDYPLLVNLKRLYELQLSMSVSIDSLFLEFSNMVENFRRTNEVVSFLLLNMYLHLSWSLHSIVNSEAVSAASLSSIRSKRDMLLTHIGYFLDSSHGGSGAKIGNRLACRVCLILAELWYLFRKANFSSTKLETLGYAPDQSAVKLFWQFCEQQLESEEEDLTKEYVELTNPDTVLIAAGKLIATDTVLMEYLGPEVISRFTMHGTRAAEIFKQLIAVIWNKVDICDIFFEALKRAYHRHGNYVSSGDGESAKRALLDCKDLSVQLCGTFMGYGRSKHIPDILKIVQNGVEYAFTNIPDHLSFLECGVLHFVPKLPAADVLDILKDVQVRAENMNPDEDPSGWHPYFSFLEILQEKYAKNEGFAAGANFGSSDASSESHGTTAIAVLCENGYVLMADSRSSNERKKNDIVKPKDLKIRDSSEKFYSINSRILCIMVGHSISGKEMRNYMVSTCADMPFADAVQHADSYFDNHLSKSFGIIICGFDAEPGSPCQLFWGYVHEMKKSTETDDKFVTLGTGRKHVKEKADRLKDGGCKDARAIRLPLMDCVQFVLKCGFYASYCDRFTGGATHVYNVAPEKVEFLENHDTLDAYWDFYDDCTESKVLFLIFNIKKGMNLDSKDLIDFFRKCGEVTYAHRVCNICVAKDVGFRFHRLVCESAEVANKIMDLVSSNVEIPSPPRTDPKILEILKGFRSGLRIKEQEGEKKSVEVYVNRASRVLLDQLRSSCIYKEPRDIG